MGIPRILEPEVMDTVEEAEGYDAMDHSEVNRLFVDELLEASRRMRFQGTQRVLDLGTGTALIPIELCRRGPEWTVCAVDLAAEMLNVARRNLAEAGLTDRIELVLADAKQVADGREPFNVVMSNSIVHHIPDPIAVMDAMRRSLKPGGLLLVRDLLRPQSVAELDSLVDTYAADATDHQRQMFRDSLHAALTLEEVGMIMDRLDLPRSWLSQSSDRHWTICGASDPGSGRR